MKQELYCYAVSLKNQVENISNIPYFCIWMLLIIFSLPILKLNIWYWTAISVSYIALFFYIKNRKDQYIKMLLKIGSFVFYLGLEMCYLQTAVYPETKRFLLLAMCVVFIAYECDFLLKLKVKVYSNNSDKTKKIINAISIVGGASGVWAGKLMADLFGNTSWIIWVTAILSAVIMIGSITYFQKCLFYKIFSSVADQFNRQ